MSCRYPDCPSKKTHRFGLCNRHRKWVERGFIDLDLNPLKKLPSKVDYSKMKCRVEECDNRPRRNFFCPKHSRQFQEKTINQWGVRIKPLVRYSKDFQCIKCGAGGKITKGFCKKHYAQLRRGLLDFDGQTLRPPKRVARYTDLHFCKVQGCGKKCRDSGFCRKHAVAWRAGSYDENGRRIIPMLHVNRGKTCLECDRPAHIRLLCPKHYYRKYQASKRVLINKGKECAAPACSRPAICKGLCTMHYNRKLQRSKRLNLTVSVETSLMPRGLENPSRVVGKETIQSTAK